MQGATSSGTMTICAQARDKTKGLPISDQLLHPLSHRSGFVASLFLFLWRFKADPLLLVCSSPLAISAQANYQVLLLCSTLNKPKSTDKETNVKLSWSDVVKQTFVHCCALLHSKSALLSVASQPTVVFGLVKSPHCSPEAGAYVFHTAWTEPREGLLCFFFFVCFFFRPQ